MTITTNRIQRRFTRIATPEPQSATKHLVQSTRFARRIAKLLLIGLCLSILGIAFLPWQQTSRGSGRVIAFVPQERQQAVEASMKGVIARIGPGLREGSKIKKGDFILEIQPFAPNQIGQMEAQVMFLKEKLKQEQEKVKIYDNQVANYETVKQRGIEINEQLIEAARAKLNAKEQLIPGYKDKQWQAQQNFDRQKRLFEKGVQSRTELEKYQKDLGVASSELLSIQKDVEALNKELLAKQKKLEKDKEEDQAKINSSLAFKASAAGGAATIQKDIEALNTKLEELGRGIVTAPRSGTILSLQVYQQGDAVKPGDPIMQIVPDTTEKAVEIYVSGNDMPLIQPNQDVQLQFEGWPAIQTAGWPSLAINTFSGVVTTVDATDNGKGKFRVLVTPNPEAEEKWPTERFLRQGVRANGWVQLRRVSLGYELWRQLNGFPVIIDDQVSAKTEKPLKIPK